MRRLTAATFATQIHTSPQMQRVPHKRSEASEVMPSPRGRTSGVFFVLPGLPTHLYTVDRGSTRRRAAGRNAPWIATYFLLPPAIRGHLFRKVCASASSYSFIQFQHVLLRRFPRDEDMRWSNESSARLRSLGPCQRSRVFWGEDMASGRASRFLTQKCIYIARGGLEDHTDSPPCFPSNSSRFLYPITNSTPRDRAQYLPPPPCSPTHLSTRLGTATLLAHPSYINSLLQAS